MPDIETVKKTKRERKKQKNKATTALSFLVTFALVEFHQVRSEAFGKISKDQLDFHLNSLF